MKVFNGFGPGTRGDGAVRTFDPPPRPVHVPYYNPYTHPTPLAYKFTELDKMPANVLMDLAAKVKLEMERRTNTDKADKQKLHDKLSNFLLGVAHACACRSALRWTAGHNPHGKDANDGRPWNALDGTKVEYCVSEGLPPPQVDPDRDPVWDHSRLYSNPMLWTTVGDITHWVKPTFSGRKTSYLR